jgi:trans-2,3-dihydro-3-hydroxyanthranilate isomerase
MLSAPAPTRPGAACRPAERTRSPDHRMPEKLRFALVDVFAEAPLTGNPVAVVADAADVEVRVLQAIAREFNQSETTFVLPSVQPRAAWRLRSFTPAGFEVGGAGHNALGAWWWLAESGQLSLGAGETQFAQEIGGRVLPVTVACEEGRPRRIAMEQGLPQRGSVVTDLAELAASLGVGDDLLGHDLPAQVVSTGAPHLLVQARNRDAVDRAAPDPPRLAATLRAVGGEGCYVYTLDTTAPDAAAYARFFNPIAGLTEDPATGTAAGPLASHLVAHGVVSEGTTVVVEQGHLVGRPSRIETVVSDGRVTISATCVITAEGLLHVLSNEASTSNEGGASGGSSRRNT